MKKVLAFGVFDGLHEGHKFFLGEARKYGDYLCVVVARDKTVYEIKNKIPKNSEEERMDFLSRSGLADKLILGSTDDPFQVVRDENPEVIVLGYDQKSKFTEKMPYQYKKRVKRLSAFLPKKYKSSLLKV